MALQVKSVQRGTFSMTGTSQTTTISAVTLNKSILFISIKAQGANPAGNLISAQLDSTTTIRFQRGATESLTVDITWTVVEFTAASNITVQRGSTSVSSTTTTQSITAVAGLNRAFTLGYTRVSSAATSGYEYREAVLHRLTSTTNINFEVHDTSHSPVVEWQVIESADITVQTIHRTTVSGTSLNDTITAVVDARTSVHASLASDQVQQLFQEKIYQYRLTSTTNVNASRNASSGDVDYFVYVVEWPSGVSVQRIEPTSFTSGATTNVTITSVDLSRSGECNIGGTNFGIQSGDNSSSDSMDRYCLSLSLTGPTNLRFIRTTNTDSLKRTAQVIEWEADSKVPDLFPFFVQNLGET